MITEIPCINTIALYNPYTCIEHRTTHMRIIIPAISMTAVTLISSLKEAVLPIRKRKKVKVPFHLIPSFAALTGRILNKEKQFLPISIELSRVLIVFFHERLCLMDTIEHASRRRVPFSIENGTNFLFDAFNGQNAFRTLCFICTFFFVFFHHQRSLVALDNRDNCNFTENLFTAV